VAFENGGADDHPADEEGEQQGGCRSKRAVPEADA
jgi:hypothetical protein